MNVKLLTNILVSTYKLSRPQLLHRNVKKWQNFTAIRLLSSESGQTTRIGAHDTTECTLTMNDVKERMIETVGVQRTFNVLVPTREHLTKYEPSSQESLPPRSMQDSFTSAVIPLSQDMALYNKYVNIFGNVRLGRLMEDMDMFAVWVVHQYLKMPDLPVGVHLPYTFVTILVDKIDFTGYKPTPEYDVRLSGHVSWVGKSSIEVVVWLEQNRGGKLHKITRALFLMASRNATNTKAAPVNPLVPANENERLIFAGGEARKRRRREIQQDWVFKNEPNDFEQKLIHDMFIKTIDIQDRTFNKRILPTNCTWMEDTRLSTSVFPYPEDRNAHNKVFGGFLMRNALELSFATAYMFSKFRPKLVAISDIAFHSPVDVSSFIKMEACVSYTEMNYLEICVVSHVFDAVTKDRTTTNDFYYTYSSPDKILTVMPRTYNEAMMFLDGRRRFQYALGLSEKGQIKDVTLDGQH